MADNLFTKLIGDKRHWRQYLHVCANSAQLPQAVEGIQRCF